MVSVYNCDFHGTRVRGRLEHAYPCLLRGGLRYARHMRLCVSHMDELLALPGLKSAQEELEGPSYDDARCAVCGQSEVSQNLLDPLFVTAYRRGEERQDFFALACEQCGNQLINGWKLTL